MTEEQASHLRKLADTEYQFKEDAFDAGQEALNVLPVLVDELERSQDEVEALRRGWEIDRESLMRGADNLRAALEDIGDSPPACNTPAGPGCDHECQRIAIAILAAEKELSCDIPSGRGDKK